MTEYETLLVRCMVCEAILLRTDAVRVPESHGVILPGVAAYTCAADRCDCPECRPELYGRPS